MTTEGILDPDNLCDTAVEHHQAGRIAEAETLYQQILRIDPGHPGALYYLAGIAYADGRYTLAFELTNQLLQDEPNDAEALHLRGATALKLEQHSVAIDSIGRALALHPAYPQAHYSLGEALQAAHRIDEAIASFRQAAALDPKFAEAYCSVGNLLKAQNRLDEAIANYQKALQLSPTLEIAQRNLGSLLHATGQLDAAIACYRQALSHNDSLEINFLLGNALKDHRQPDDAVTYYRRALQIRPDFIPALVMLARLDQDRGRFEAAADGYRRVLAVDPEFAEGHVLLGNTLAAQRLFEAAISSYQRALALQPAAAETHFYLGLAYKELGRRDIAIGHYRQALALKSDYLPACVNLASLHQELGQYPAAIAYYRQALTLKADFAEVLSSLGNSLKDQGELDEAIACYRQALEIKPDYAEAYSNYLLALQYLPNYSRERLLADHTAFAEHFEQPLRAHWPRHANSRDPQRRLKVGFVSGDLHNHPVGFFLEGVLRYIDRQLIDVTLYSSNDAADGLTERLRALGFNWTSVAAMSDSDAAQCIEADHIDILIDLSGHTGYNRLLVFARKPAPLQVAWLGYWATTGLRSIDYILGDRYCIPSDEAKFFVEQPCYLPHTRLCFTPPSQLIDVQPLPALRCGHVTFACFNNLAKITDVVVALWARILHGVESSQLLLKSAAFADDAMRQNLCRRFAIHGISADRLLLEAFSARADYFSAYHRVDIALDPFPFTGATTSIEGLWMGVPLITRRGDRMVAHQGEGILHNIGLPDWIAEDDDAYVALAIKRASDLAALADLRASLRSRLLAAPLCDAAAFAQHLQAALRIIWQTYCDT